MTLTSTHLHRPAQDPKSTGTLSTLPCLTTQRGMAGMGSFHLHVRKVEAQRLGTPPLGSHSQGWDGTHICPCLLYPELRHIILNNCV